MPSKIKDLGSVLPKEMQEGDTLKLDDYMDKPLIIHTCREVQGKNGSYMRLVVSEAEEGKQFYLATGASQVCEILAYLKENRLFPVRGKFVTAGRAILLKSPD